MNYFRIPLTDQVAKFMYPHHHQGKTEMRNFQDPEPEPTPAPEPAPEPQPPEDDK